MAAFAMFASDLDATTRSQLTRGERLMELLKQPQSTPYPVEEQVASIWVGTHGYLDKLDVSDVSSYEHQLLDYLRSHSDVLTTIRETGVLDDDTENALREAAEKFTQQWLSAQPGENLEDGEVEAEHSREEIVRRRREKKA